MLFHKKQNKEGIITTRYVLPNHLINKVTDTVHSSVFGGHLGVEKTREKITSRFYFPKINQKIEKFIRECDTCQKVKTTAQNIAPLIPILPSKPSELITTDLAGPLPVTVNGNTHIMVICDHFTKFVAAYPLSDTTAPALADVLIDYMCKYGLADNILSDLGTNLQSQLLELVYETLDINRLKTTPYHPQCDGISERFVQTLKQMITSFVDENHSNWDQLLNKLTYAYNSSVHSATKQSPFQMQFGRKPKIPLDLIIDNSYANIRPERTENVISIDDNNTIVTVTDKIEEYDKKLPQLGRDYMNNLKKNIKIAHEQALKNRNIYMNKAKIIYDRKIKPYEYKVGDLVLSDHPQLKIGQTHGLAHKYHGPFQILNKVNQVDYLITRADKPGDRKFIIHHNRLKKYFGDIKNIDNESQVKTEKSQKNVKNKRKYIKNPLCSRWNKKVA